MNDKFAKDVDGLMLNLKWIAKEESHIAAENGDDDDVIGYVFSACIQALQKAGGNEIAILDACFNAAIDFGIDYRSSILIKAYLQRFISARWPEANEEEPTTAPRHPPAAEYDGESILDAIRSAIELADDDEANHRHVSKPVDASYLRALKKLQLALAAAEKAGVETERVRCRDRAPSARRRAA